MMWHEFYATKRRQQDQIGLRCPGNCGRWPTQSHHLFVRRPDHPSLQEDWNIIQVCSDCHIEEWKIQVRGALMKIEEYGPEYIEMKIRQVPRQIRDLPKNYMEALLLYKEGVRAFIDY